jgi:phosphatidylserine decarboxylase
MRIAKEGLIFIAPAAALALVFCFLGWWIPFIPALLLVLAFVFFFRDPKRTIPADEDLLVSPADGKVVRIESVPSPSEFPGPVHRISIFLSLLDVHVTRSPLAGAVEKVEYKRGTFFRADKDEASRSNESNTLLIRGQKTPLLLKQIVGVAARRIKCFVQEGTRVERGQKIGLMYFGSRVETYLPQDIIIKARLDQKVKAGVTVIAEVKK